MSVPALFRGFVCPICEADVHDVYQHIDFSRDTFGMVCPECGRLECDRDGTISRILGVAVERPPSVGVREWNRSVREVEKAVIANHEAAMALLKRCKS